MKRQLIFLIESRLDGRDYVRFGIQYLSSRYRVQVLDCTHLIYPRIPAQPTTVAAANYRYEQLSNRKDVKELAPGGSGNIVIDMLGETIEANAVRRQVFRNGGLRVALSLGGLHFSTPPMLDRFAKLMKNVRSLASLRRFIHRSMARAENLLAPVPKVDLLICGGRADSNGGKAIEAFAHSFDYERWRAIASLAPSRSGNYAIFLDEDIVYHPDFARSGLRPPVSEATYYPAINLFFEEYERQTGLSVFVAAHPRSRYDERSYLWGERTLIHGRTLEAVAGASHVFAHFSTSLSFAILANKPVTHLVSNDLLKSFMGPKITGVSHFLNTRLINFDHEYPKKIFLGSDQIDSARYRAYKNLYIKADGALEAPLWEIIADALDRYAADTI
jgi:hypothetical protein